MPPTIPHSPTPTPSPPAPKRKHAPVPTPLPASYKEAAVKAQQYVDSMHLSEECIRDQLTGKRDHYSQWAAQYAIEHVTADYPAHSLIIAQDLQRQGAPVSDATLTLLTIHLYIHHPYPS
ncbi:Ltp family lipoprotein, partial [Bifidobacterium xylocopae]|uniref:Ltp family lipoprotein n=1 Tax=Bifidobacterium xylocopae TaxID=2493119 RepID=UPI00191BC6E1